MGDDVAVLSRVPSGEHAGAIVGVQQGNVMATSFHPEVSGDTRVHAYFASLVEQAGYTHP